MLQKFLVLCISIFILQITFALASEINLPRTGQNICYIDGGSPISCAGSGLEGDILPGQSWPSPRFADNGNGTVSDNLTGLVWMRDAHCTDIVGGVYPNSWYDALTWSNNMASGYCGLTDNTTAGQWRLPNKKELLSLVDLSRYNPALPQNHPFLNVQNSCYYSSTTKYNNQTSYGYNNVWILCMAGGNMNITNKASGGYVWLVRGGVL